MVSVIKRDERIVAFDSEKIFKAIEKAFISNDYEEIPKDVEEKVKNLVRNIEENYQKIEVEEIQDLVENLLLDFPEYRRVALSYIKYRTKHEVARTTKITEDMAKSLLDIYLKDRDDMATHENASFSYSLAGLNNYIASEVSEKYWLSMLPEDVAEWHRKGKVHLHDMGLIAGYCAGWDLYDFLLNGMKSDPNKTVSSPPKHFSSALGQLANFIYIMQSEFAGAQAVSNFDILLAPFIRYDGLSYKQVKQFIQEFIYQVNSPQRVGYQQPFFNITLDLVASDSPYADDYVIIGGEMKIEQYKDFQSEVDMINKAFAEIMTEGDANHNIFQYPIPTYNITRDLFDKVNSEVLDAISEMTVKYGVPYFANFINSDLDPSQARSMCCRLRLDLSEVEEHLSDVPERKGGGFFGADPLTGSVAVGTISLPYLMTETLKENEGKDKEEIFKIFIENVKKVAKRVGQALEVRRKFVERMMDRGLYPNSKFWLRNAKQKHGEYFARHFSTIGINGMHEAMLILGFENGLMNEKAQELTKEFLKEMNAFMKELKKEYGHLFNLEQTPSESAGVKLVRKSGIDPEGKGYYTNSTWLASEYASQTDPFDLVIMQGEFNKYYTGGSVQHIYIGENITTMKNVILRFVKKIFEASEIPYITISPVFAVCDKCGTHIPLTQKEASKEFVECSHCGNLAPVYSRIVGYYRAVKNWNDGRKAEHKRRYHFDELDVKEGVDKALKVKNEEKKEENEEVVNTPIKTLEFKSISLNS